MAKVTGIGGIFLKFKDPIAMRTWYQEVLGLTTNDYGVLFRFNIAGQREGYLQLGTFEEETSYFGEASQRAMINFRVDNMEEMVGVLKKHGVQLLNEVEVYEYGKFLHIADPEGNRIELWEPIDQSFTDSKEAYTIMH